MASLHREPDQKQRSRAMRSVVIVVDNDPSRIERITKIASSMQSMGDEVLLISPRYGESVPYHAIAIPCFRRPAPLHYFTFGVGILIALLFIRRKIVHFVNHPDFVLPAVCLGCKLTGTRMVYDRRVNFAAVIAMRSHPFIASVARTVEEIGYRSADVITVVVPGLRRSLKRYSAKVELVPNGVDLSMFHPDGAPHRKFVVTCVAALTESEGVEVFVKAASLVRKTDRTIMFQVAGDGELGHQLKQLSRKLGGPVVFRGWVSHDQVPALLRSSDVCVSSVVSLPYSRDAHPVKLFEYLASGKPVIVSDVPGHLDLIRDGHNAIVYRAESPTDLAAKIIALKKDPTLRERLSKNGLRVAKKYSWVRCFRKLSDVYSRLSQAKPS
jgi:glycosyltransferase involved in cell wall biosynthesis